MLTILSLGAGVQSSTIALMAARGEIEGTVDACIFADTGAEPTHIYDYLDFLEKELPFPIYRVSKGNLRDDVVNASERSRVATPPFFTGSAGDHGMLRRQCTREYKVEPITKKVRELAGLKPRQRTKDIIAQQWIGISWDEALRMKPSRQWYIEHRWPLIEKEMRRSDCLNWMERHGYPLPKKSACTFCPYHDDAAWREMKRDDPESWQDAVSVDRAVRDGIRGTKEKLYVHRFLKPLDEVDFSTLEDLGQGNLFIDQCEEGMCGV